MLILSSMLPAVNTVVFATILQYSYEEAAVSAILGIIMAMDYDTTITFLCIASTFLISFN
ncbi:MAG: hypothetical protein MTP17_03995 [Candidatus Midichloria sp.]|nr:MAG: hypothetical protein MTP17_03995 [Candidatus Midichloria sp.]